MDAQTVTLSVPGGWMLRQESAEASQRRPGALSRRHPELRQRGEGSGKVQALARHLL